MRVHLLHGIHTALGNPMVEELIPYLAAAGFEVKYPDYGWIAALETKAVNPLIVHTLLPYIEPGDLFVGHSNGCAVGYDLMNAGAPIAGAVFINAALERNIVRRRPCEWIDVYFNAGDDTTEAAKFFAELGMVDSCWGEMGHAGYLGSDSAIVSHDCGNTAGLPAVSGHSAIFDPGNIKAWAPAIMSAIRAHFA